jgi:hypothetical protein
MPAYSLEIEQETGLGSLTVKLALANSNTVAATVTMTERSNMAGIYAGSVTADLDGFYNASINAGSDFVGTDQFELVAAGGSFQSNGLRAGQTKTIIDALPDSLSWPVTAQAVDRVDASTIKLFTQENLSVSITVLDENGAAVNISSFDMVFVISDKNRAVLHTITNDYISVDGEGNNIALVTIPATISESSGRQLYWSLRKTGSLEVLGHGKIEVAYAPEPE